MDITLSKAQQDFVKEARRFLKKECTKEFIDEMYESETGYTDELWSKLIGVDWMAMTIPEKYDGMGMDLLDMALILEETGRALMPGPFFSTVLCAAEAVKIAGTEKQKDAYLKKIANGEIKGTLAVYEPDSGLNPDYIQMEAAPQGDGYKLNGTKLMVPDAHVADFIICAARTGPEKAPEEGVTLFIIDPGADGVRVSLLPTMDAVRKYCEVELTDVAVGPDQVLGAVNDGSSFFKAVQRANVGLAAESVGAAQWAMEAAVDYAKIRIQFDQPIGSFQAIKHKCAEMFKNVESARSLLYYAAWAQDHEDDDTAAAVAASAAKAYCTEAFNKVVCDTVQVMGGAGFIWENEVHFYLKRAKANQMVMGDPNYHREKVLRLLSY
jgi:alkylation response protein AidB-like acyl-CoA dehydrogenase